METAATTNEKVCPKCGSVYRGHPALSRVDNATPICQKCGTREALESMGLGLDEIEKIIAAIPCFEDK